MIEKIVRFNSYTGIGEGLTDTKPLIFDLDELLARIGLKSNDKHLNPYKILQTGFAKYGIEFFKWVNGSFVFFDIDKQSRKLTVVHSAFSKASVFYYVAKESIIISGFLKNLVELEEIPKDINGARIVSTLNFFRSSPGETCYKSIKFLPAGHVLTFDQTGIKIFPYRDFNDIKEIRLKNDAEYVEQFLELYRDAVRKMIPDTGKTGILLSGGLDSGTIAVLASEELARQGKNLYSYSHVPRYDTTPFLPKTKFGNEGKYVELLCKQYKNIKPAFFDTPHISPVDGINRTFDLSPEPFFLPINTFWQHDILESAQRDGIKTLLTGMNGNMSVSYTGWEDHSKGLVDFIHHINWVNLYYEKIALKDVAKLLLPKQILNRIQKGRRNIYSKNWRDFSAINPDYAEQIGITDIPPFPEEETPRYFLFKKSSRGVAELFPCLESRYGVEFLYPAFDKKLVDFCCGIPDEQYRRYGINKFLIRRAFNEKMPKEILWNKSRGKQGADICLRVRDEHKRIKHILEVLKKSPSAKAMLNLQKMEDVLNRTLKEENLQILPDTHRTLLLGVMVGLFLLRNDGDKNEY